MGISMLSTVKTWIKCLLLPDQTVSKQAKGEMGNENLTKIMQLPNSKQRNQDFLHLGLISSGSGCFLPLELTGEIKYSIFSLARMWIAYGLGDTILSSLVLPLVFSLVS